MIDGVLLRIMKEVEKMRNMSKAFVRGFIRCMDLSGTKKWPDISNSETKDYESLRSDWENVGRDIRKGTEKYGKLFGRG